MTTIVIPPEIELPLSEAAKRQGTTPELLAVESLRRIYAPTSEWTQSINGGSLADFLQGYIGTISGVSEPLSEDTGRRYTDELLAERQRKSL
jgi:hypothetical protein